MKKIIFMTSVFIATTWTTTTFCAKKKHHQAPSTSANKEALIEQLATITATLNGLSNQAEQAAVYAANAETATATLASNTNAAPHKRTALNDPVYGEASNNALYATNTLSAMKQSLQFLSADISAAINDAKKSS